MSKNKAVFLDRDGTVIVDMVYLNDPEKILVYEESYEAIKKLNDAGYLVILATNQSGVARGIVQESNVKLINKMIMDDFKSRGAQIIDAYYCPHPVDGGCHCRKPNPGMLEMASEKHGIDLSKSWMVGDRMTDVVAGLKAGCKSILLQNSTTPPIEPQFGTPPHISENILTAANLILENLSNK